MTYSTYAQAWALDPQITLLNHGAFGACPRAVLELQQRLRAEMEREPVGFFLRRVQPLLDESRRTLAALVGADPADLVFVRNATTGINSVLRSLEFQPGDELLVTDHGYNACRNAVRYVAQRSGARVVVASLPLSVESPRQVVDAVIARVTGRTRLAVIDHVTSPTAVVFPIQELVRQLHERNVDTLVDGAHAPGMIPLDLGRIGAAYYAGNCHKWLCAPKGAGFLHVRPDRQREIQPAVISHGFNTPRPGYTRFQDAFDWPGTDDPTPWLCVGEAIRFLESLTGGGMEGLMQRNHQLVLEGRRTLCEALDLSPTCPEEMIGSIAAFCLPDDTDAAAALDASTAITPTHRWQLALLDRFGIQVPVYHWPAAPRKLLRISAQAYNSPAQYEQLAAALTSLL
jgi:isopenicillin-N epimerase